MKIEHNYFIVTLCNTDLECQEIEFFNHEQAEEAASRLRKFLPQSLIHSVILEGVDLVDVGNPADEDGYIELEERRTELNF
jgi:hypothetical protein